LTPIPLPYGAADVRGDIASSGDRALLLWPLSGQALAGRTLRGSPKLLLLQLHNQSIERPFEDLSDVIRANGMAEQGLGVPQFIVRALADRELK
jgi:hypothetical protein